MPPLIPVHYLPSSTQPHLAVPEDRRASNEHGIVMEHHVTVPEVMPVAGPASALEQLAASDDQPGPVLTVTDTWRNLPAGTDEERAVQDRAKWEAMGRAMDASLLSSAAHLQQLRPPANLHPTTVQFDMTQEDYIIADFGIEADLMAMAFPNHFPFGLGCWGQPRVQPWRSFSDWFQHQLQQADQSMARDPAFLAAGWGLMYRKEAAGVAVAAQHSEYVQAKAHGMLQAMQQALTTTRDIEQALQAATVTTAAREVVSSMSRYATRLPGTPAYSNQVRKDNLALLSCVPGEPSFITISRPDQHDPYISKIVHRDFSDAQLRELTVGQKWVSSI